MRLIVGVLLGISALAGFAWAEPAAAQAPPVIYTIHTRTTTAELFTPAVVGVPMAVDATGDLIPDIQFTLTASPPSGGNQFAAIDVLRLRPDAFSLFVEAIIPVDGRQVTVGYDGYYNACGSSGYVHLEANIGIRSIAKGRFIQPGRCITILAGLSGGDPNALVFGGQLILTPVPPEITVDVEQWAGLKAAVSVAEIRPHAVMTIETGNGVSRTRVDATVNSLPPNLLISRIPNQQTSYSADAAVDLATVRITTTNAGQVTRQIWAYLDDLPAGFTTLIEVGGQLEFLAPAPVGQIEFAMAENGDVQTAHVGQSTPDYLRIHEQGTHTSIAARARGVRRVVLQRSGDMSVSAEHAGGQFHVIGSMGTRNVDAWVRNLPANFSLAIARSGTAVTYTGGSPIGEITANVTDTAPIAARFKRIEVIARDVPTGVTLTVGASSSGKIELSAGDKTIGFLQLHATSGPNADFPQGSHPNGFSYTDFPDPAIGQRVLVRISKLQSVTVERVEGAVACHVSGARRDCGKIVKANVRLGAADTPFTLWFNKPGEDGKHEYVRVDTTLPAQTTFELATTRAERHHCFGIICGWQDLGPLYMSANYTGRDAAGQPRATAGLTVATSLGDRNYFTVTASPLPSDVNFCKSEPNTFLNGQPSDSFCTGTGRVASAGSMAINASNRFTVNAFDCVRPLTGCSESNVSKWMRVTNLNLKQMSFEVDTEEGRATHHLYADTGGHSVSGKIDSFDWSKLEGTEINLNNVWARARMVDWTYVIAPVRTSHSGTMFCTQPGTSVWANPEGGGLSWLNMTGALGICNAA